MATTTKLLQLRPKLKPFSQPTPNFFSSSSSSSNSNPENTPPPSEPHQTPPPTPKPFSFSSISNNPQNPSSNSSSFDEIRKNLAEFRLRAATAAAAGGGGRSPPPSFQELYKKNVSTVRPTPTTGGKVDFDTIRASLNKFKENNNNSNNENRGKFFDSLSLSQYKDSLKLRPNVMDKGGSGMVIGGSSGSLPASIFGKEMMMRADKEGGGGGDKEGMGMTFVRTYRHGELGEKLKKLRPVKKEEKGGFSLQELKDRLVKVRETDKENKSKWMIGGGVFMELEEALHKLTQPDGEKAKKTMIQRLDVLGQLGGTPSFMLHPPKEQLVETFFHPDHMSSGEKMKLELQNVRDEFKMSESDCGSARVQVAQLTTKIKHLSGVLHKKDKHSRKGLQEMVQKRKKLLKYLRRTDWDSYCLVLSKLGLRDNPDYKF